MPAPLPTCGMKVLVVDDDVIARKVLGAFLKQSNYEMSIVEDGQSAFRALTAPDAPLVAIIDWMMPDISGPELCAKLRQHDFAVQPYLLMLSGRKEKTDIAAALDAGADDFISKPFNIQEMQARLRVATRSVQRQLDLLLQLNELRAELEKARSSQPASAASSPAAPSAEIETSSSAVEPPRTGMTLLEDYQIDIIVAGALRHAGQIDTPRRLACLNETQTRVAWAGILLVKEETWVDLFVEINPASAQMFLAQARGTSSQHRNPLDYCATFQNSLRDSLASVLRAMGCEIQTPLPTSAIRDHARTLPLGESRIERHPYRVGDVEFTFAFVEYPCPLREKSTDQLQLCDVLAQPYPPANTHRVPLLRAGVVLKEQFIEKLQDFASATATEVPPVLVHTPSPVALHFK